MITVREFGEQDRDELLGMVQEVNECDANFEGLEEIGRIETYHAFLEKLERWKHQEQIPPEYAPQTIFGAFNDNKLIGGFVLRHAVKGTLINHGGNIGYFVRPCERKKGYGTILLKLALEKAGSLGLEKVLVTCRTGNIGSAKVIESNGGEYENDYCDESSGETYRRYWIACQ